MSLPCLDDAQMLIPDVLESHGIYFRHKEAVVCGNVRRNWGDFNRNTNRVANTLLQLGIGRGSKVAVLMGGTSAERDISLL